MTSLGKRGRNGFAVRKSLWETCLCVPPIRGLDCRQRGDGGAVVHVLGGMQADTRVTMVAVVPIKEIPTKVSGLLALVPKRAGSLVFVFLIHTRE